ncbi:alpha-rhamnosidase [Segetibacter sp. 3557_3]|uniref:alpha-L-rhamnosidase n=1 Tax=Segetibacter sp. 3557_3 TaxID=2547429 RepID=UPI001058C249|nr:alpha-L-rhamnosidase [Segetibacter sp. 3557_3]TDH27455.1 alpha-rhamnosidase [Segetibacter sp. 3557_3]
MKFTSPIIALCVVAITFTSFRDKPSTAVQLVNLRTEMLTNPLGIDTRKPRLSWELASDQRGVEQVAYNVLVASSPSKLAANEGDLWNSGKVSSNQSIHISYNGKPLHSRAECYWKVKTWTKTGENEWSSAQHWSMGLLEKTDWQAKWTGLDKAFPWDSVTKMSRLSARYFRKNFTAPKQLQKATVYISGLGLYELYINGQKIGDQVLAPAPTDYSQSLLYNTFDVTNNIKTGTNAIATVLGNGRFFAMRQNYKPQKWHTFGYPKMLLQLEMVFTDGSKQTVISDGSWKVTADGPIRTNNEYDGEEYDATKEIPNWNYPIFDDRKWLDAQLVKAPGGRVVSQMTPPMKVMETLKPVSVKQLRGDTVIMDMGQNMAGWVRMKVKGDRGRKVTLRFAESLTPDGGLYTANLRDALVTDVYTLRGIGEETWAPSFVYHGFRYVEITNYPGKAGVGDFVGEVVYDQMQTTGTFETSDRTINQIHKNAYWGIRGNYKGMPIDCPQRNERQPWLGDRATGAYGESFIFDNGKLYAKWLKDIQQSQTAEGSIPDVAPSFWFYYKDNVTWPGTYLMIANMLYNQYGDKQPIIDHYASMKKWMKYMQGKYMTNYIVTKDSYGDWCVPPESPELIHSKDSSRITDPQLLATATYYHMLQLMQRFATLSGQTADVPGYAALAEKVKAAFQKKFYNPETKNYSNNTVTANILPLAFKMVPEGADEAVFQHIVDKTMIENKGHISTGVIGTQWLMRWLTKYGRADIAFRLASIRDYPSWGYMAENGATTIWELWNGNTANPSMNSQNHVMLLGDLVVWYYENLGGIKTSTENPGFKVIEMKPSFVEGLTKVHASYQSVHGLIKSEWNKTGSSLKWDISVPGNAKAIVFIPASSSAAVMESGKAIPDTETVKFLRMEAGNAVYEVGSGSYSFSTGK